MIIQDISGGLGNQIMMYVFGRYMERRNPNHPLLFDDSYFSLYKILNGYELEKIFGLKLDFLSRHFDQDTWEGILSLYKKQTRLPVIPRFFYDAGVPIVLLTPWTTYSLYFPGMTIVPEHNEQALRNLPYSNIYCKYTWGPGNYWFMQDREENLKELAFPQLADKKNLNYADEIRTHDMSVGIHVRMGGYGYYTPQFIRTYRQACERVVNEYPDAWFFIFSDHPDWAKVHAAEMGFDLAARTIYIEGNDHGKNYIDLQLMSMCHGLIGAGISTFFRLAGWFDLNLKFQIEVDDFTLNYDSGSP